MIKNRLPLLKNKLKEKNTIIALTYAGVILLSTITSVIVSLFIYTRTGNLYVPLTTLFLWNFTVFIIFAMIPATIIDIIRLKKPKEQKKKIKGKRYR